MPPRSDRRRARILAAAILLAVVGCGEPSDREARNARAFEALLTAVTLRDAGELESDAGLIERRHESGELSDAAYREIREVVDRARAKDWPGAERRAYEFRSRFGDRGSYFR